MKDIKNKNFHLYFDKKNEYNTHFLIENSSNEILTSVQEIISNRLKYSFSEFLINCNIKIPANDTDANITESFYKKLKKINNL